MKEKGAAENTLGTEKIPKLLASLAIPAIVANLVNAMYNIVDQIFIGQGVGYLGNAATSISFPITTVCLAVGLMTGLGGASNFNIEQGRNNSEDAKKIIQTAVWMSVISGILICIIVRSFLDPLMNLFGATDQTISYARQYSGITSWGIPFFIFSTAVNPLIRADKRSTYSMIALIAGAVLNIILDALFILVLDWGMRGAAWATVIGQALAAVILAVCLTRFRSVKFSLKKFLPDFNSLKAVVTVGMSSFIYQISTMFVQIITNNVLKTYGGLSSYGSDIAISVAGIVSKINLIFTSIVIGIVQGAQPISSYNYGIKNWGRVHETVKLLMKVTLIISIIAFAVFEFFPSQIISVFGEESDEYFKFGTKFMRIYLFFTFLNGMQIAGMTFFQTIGKAGKGVIVSLIKQVVFLIPLLLILPRFIGVDGIIYATPVSDLISFFITISLLIIEMKKFPVNKKQQSVLSLSE